jgi:hypothetical protein
VVGFSLGTWWSDTQSDRREIHFNWNRSPRKTKYVTEAVLETNSHFEASEAIVFLLSLIFLENKLALYSLETKISNLCFQGEVSVYVMNSFVWTSGKCYWIGGHLSISETTTIKKKRENVRPTVNETETS